MKKVFYAVLIVGLMAFGALARDMVVAPSALPQSAQNFIKSNFPNADIRYVEQDYDGFEVQLTNGTEIDFYANGEWEEIKARGEALPASVLPAKIAEAVKKTYPNAMIYKVEKDWNGYEVKLNNRMELYFGNDGALIGQKKDY